MSLYVLKPFTFGLPESFEELQDEILNCVLKMPFFCFSQSAIFSPEPSYVLRAIGLSYEEAEASVRFSFGMQNTPEQIEEAVDYIVAALASLNEGAMAKF